VRRSLTPDGKSYNQPKSAKGRRSVRLTLGAVEALKLHKINQDREKACLGSLWQEQGLVFPSSIGPRSTFRAPAETCGAAPDKVPRPGAHLRHLDVLQRRATEDRPGDPGPRADHAHLGHNSHVLPSMQEGAVGRLGELLD
jgi:integrase